MKTIIAGSRTILDFGQVEAILDLIPMPSEVVSGGARGVDTLGERWAKKNNIPVKVFPADWKRYGKKAGFIRNVEMAKYADNAVIIWDGTSKGSKHMKDIMDKIGKDSSVFCVSKSV